MRTLLLATAAFAFSSSVLHAAEETISKAEIAALLKTVKEQGQKIEQQQRMLESLQKKIAQSPAAPTSPSVVQAEAQPAPSRSQPRKSQAPQEVGVERKPAPAERPPEIAHVIEEGGVLLPRGKMVITPSAEYTRSSATRVSIEGFSVIPALNIGLFDINQVNRDTLTGAVSARLGVTNRIEIDAKVPYVKRHDETLNRPIGASGADVLTQVDGDGLGDIELGAHYQINRGLGGWPFLIGNLRYKSTTGDGPFDVPTNPATGLQTELPTGSGFSAWQPSITAIYPSDPAVFYANVGYIYNVEQSYASIGKIDPGDSIGASFGMSLSLNDKSSFSVGYSHNTVLETKVNDQKLRNSAILQVGTIDFGYAYTVSDLIALNLNVSAGITDDAPDSRVTLRVPISFDLF